MPKPTCSCLAGIALDRDPAEESRPCLLHDEDGPIWDPDPDDYLPDPDDYAPHDIYEPF